MSESPPAKIGSEGSSSYQPQLSMFVIIGTVNCTSL